MLIIKKITLAISVLTVFGCASTQKKEGRDPSSVSVLAAREAQAGRLKKTKNIYEELTGKKSKVPYTDAQLRKLPLSAQHYYAGVRAAEAKNYILAIKQYNTVIKKYPSSKEVKSALLAKASLYKEMGLREPASLNIRLAQQKTKPEIKSVRAVKAKSAKQVVRIATAKFNKSSPKKSMKSMAVNKKSASAETDVLKK